MSTAAPRRILITGASVAGTAAAYWLARRGFDVSVVERTPEFRDGGQNIDVRGEGREVLRRMGLEAEALRRGTGEEGTAWIEADGSVAAEFRTDETTGDGPTAEMEILRGDLARLLYEAASPQARFRFGDYVSAVTQDPEGVDVTFAGGGTARFDLLVSAEGVGSSTRELVFPGENEPRWMDLTIAFFTIPRVAEDDQLWRWYNATEGRSVSLRPDRHGTTRAMLSIQHPSDGEQDWDDARRKAWLHQRFEDAGWQARRVLQGMDATDDFYFDVLRQVRLPRWSHGRVALLGDAAWCVTPLAGVGATLALVGAYVLAGELAREPDLSAALFAYERVMRPMAQEAGGVPKIGPRMMNPHSRLGIQLLHGALDVASRPTVRALTSKLSAKRTGGPDLSVYDDAPDAALGGRSGSAAG